MRPAAWTRLKGKKVFVTGDTGFKGAWLCFWLHELGAQVRGYALPPERSHDLFCRLGLAKRVRHQDGDIRDAEKLKAAVTRFSPDVVIHMAAQALVRRSYEDPVGTFETNVSGSVNLLEAVRACPSARALVYVTSDKCYKNKGLSRGYREEDELGGADPYSASKAAAELVFSAYQRSYFARRNSFGAASARAGNVIGGGDWSADRIVPDAIRAFASGKTLILRNPKATRPWQHVLEPLSGYLMLAAKLLEDPERCSGAWNFGPDGARTVLDLVEALGRGWNGRKPRVRIVPSTLHEAKTLHVDSRKARRALGWRPRWDFERTVAETALWYKQAAAGVPAQEACRSQIGRYLV